MATESPIRILEGTDKWAPLKQPSRYESSSSAKIAIEDLGLFMKGQRFQSLERDVIPSRSESAPPSMEGSMAAIGYMISQRKSTFNPHAKCVDGSLQLPASSLPSYQEESEDDGSSEQCGSQSLEKVAFVDSGSCDSTQELSLSYKPVKEMVVPEADSDRHDVSGSISTGGTYTPSRDDMRQVSRLDGAEGNVTRTILHDRDLKALKVAHQDNISTGGITVADNIRIEAEKRVSLTSASNSDSDRFHKKEQSIPQNNIHQQQASSSSVVQGSYPQMIYPGLSNPYGSLNPIHYGSATAFMTSPYTFYPNMQPAGLIAPQYGMSGYAFNPAVIPSYLAGFPLRHAGPMVFDGASVPTFGVSDARNMHAYDMHNLQKFYSQFGVQVQPSFSDPFHMQGVQPPAQDLYGKYGHIGHPTPRDGAVVDQVNFHELRKGPNLVGFSHDNKSVHSAGTGYKSMNFRKGNMSSPTNVSPLPQFPSASSVSQVSARPAGEINIPGGRYNTSHSHSSGNPGKTYGLQNQSWNDGNSYSFLEELKSGKGPKFELTDIAGHIVEFSVDQHGSRFIQQQLESCSDEAKASVFKEVIPNAPKLMTDVFGNYVIQKLFEYGNPEQRKDLANQLAGQILALSLQMYGCRVIQKAVEVVDLEQKARLVRELDGHVLRCVRDQNGNHVIQKCIETIPIDKIQFIISSFRGQVATLSMHPYGCRVIQRVLEHCKDELHIQFIVDEILDSVYSLAQDQYGNYVTQHVLERGKPQERSIIIEKLLGSIVQLSQHKFASNVIEKCLEYCDSTARGTLIKEIVGHDDKSENLLIMMKDQYANYVIQKILRKCTSDQREMLLCLIRNHLVALRKYTYGKHIVARFEELCGEEIQKPEPSG